MKITAAMAADLAILTQALDAPGVNVADSLRQLAADAAAAIPDYLGLSVIVSESDLPITFTLMADGPATVDIRASLRIMLSGGRNRLPVALVLRSGVPGALVELAADLALLATQPLTDLIFDQDLTEVDSASANQLQAATDINQAIGFLIGRGYTPHVARQHLDAQAVRISTSRHAIAQLILSEGDG
ncbi:hypothetical protein B5566_09040 [Mycobacterium sp. MHSD3]|uniref:hypothetical protein n=1 Tax=Mycobacteroides chelonae TaxID=1774 RepID=UPI000C6E90D6|nr:hypothetical protein [Mycobacteroides chelonae]MBF9520206.1 hypothetical protein [Mycobacteroides chelonae]PKQ58302.1 hypothetical protein B5566_09040 [Mycobacterium sp. MHSD3]